MNKWIVVERRYRWGGDLPLFFAAEVTKETAARWYYVPPEAAGQGGRKQERYVGKSDPRVSSPFPSEEAANERIAALEEVYGAEIRKVEVELDALKLALSNLKQARRKDLKAPHEA